MKQLDLFGDERIEKKECILNNDTIIKNISYDSTEILHNIGVLYNNGSDQFDADMTASTLGFYGKGRGKYEIPVPRLLFDVCPLKKNITKINRWGGLPLQDGSIHSLVCDLPFVISPSKSPSNENPKASKIAKRFASYYPADNLYLSYHHWLSEASRVLDIGGLLIFKLQTVISGGIRHNIEEFAFMAGQRLNLRMEDKFTLLAKNRLIPASKYKRQQHSRSYTSQYLVFIKDNRRRSKVFIFEQLLDRCEREAKEGYVNVIEK